MAHFAKSLRWGAACLAAVMTTACGGSGGTPPELRETRYGMVRGTDDSATSGTYAWKGVPYAQPPRGGPALAAACRACRLDGRTQRHPLWQRLPADGPHLRTRGQQPL